MPTAAGGVDAAPALSTGVWLLWGYCALRSARAAQRRFAECWKRPLTGIGMRRSTFLVAVEEIIQIRAAPMDYIRCQGTAMQAGPPAHALHARAAGSGRGTAST